jgi:hypothetical protein
LAGVNWRALSTAQWPAIPLRLGSGGFVEGGAGVERCCAAQIAGMSIVVWATAMRVSVVFTGKCGASKLNYAMKSRNIRRLREIHQKLRVPVDLTLQPNTFIKRPLSYCCDLAFSDGT